MENAVSVLLGFPSQQALLTDADYDIAVNAHLLRIDVLFRENAATIAQQGVGILQVLHLVPLWAAQADICPL